MDIAIEGEEVLKEVVTSSTGTLNSFANSTYAGETIVMAAFVKPVRNILRRHNDESLVRERGERVGTWDTYNVQKQASFFHLGQFSLLLLTFYENQRLLICPSTITMGHVRVGGVIRRLGNEGDMRVLASPAFQVTRSRDYRVHARSSTIGQ